VIRIRREVATDFLARATVAALFTLLSINLLGDFARTGRVTGVLLLASESLVVVFTILRRRAHLVDRSLAATLATTLSLAGPSLVRATAGSGLAPDMVTTTISAVGLILIVVGKLTLGRSFGLVPANRGVVVAGPYALVWHPIYTGYLITHVAFLIAFPTWSNLVLIVASDTALIVRALMEERVLGRDVEYQVYCQRVGWHLVPGVF